VVGMPAMAMPVAMGTVRMIVVVRHAPIWGRRAPLHNYAIQRRYRPRLDPESK
jgi:hypothetical protein